MAKLRSLFLSQNSRCVLRENERRFSLSGSSLAEGASLLVSIKEDILVILVGRSENMVRVVSLKEELNADLHSINDLLFSKKYLVVVARGLSSSEMDQSIALEVISQICAYHGLSFSPWDESKEKLKQYLSESCVLDVEIRDDDSEGLFWNDWKILNKDNSITRIKFFMDDQDVRCEKTIQKISYDRGYL